MSKDIAHPDPTAVLDTAAKFFRVMDKAGVPFKTFTLPLQKVEARHNLVEYLKMGCPKVSEGGIINGALSKRDLVRLILRDDFIAPEEVVAVRGLVYTEKQLKSLNANLPSLEVIAWFYENNYILIPTPPEPLSLLAIRDLNRELFYAKKVVGISISFLRRKTLLKLPHGLASVKYQFRTP